MSGRGRSASSMSMTVCAQGRPEMRDSTLQSLNLSRDAAVAAGAGAGRRPARPNTGYSRFVNPMKFILPAVAAGPLLLIVAWPRLPARFDRRRLRFPRLDPIEARDLRMVTARFPGIDKLH